MHGHRTTNRVWFAAICVTSAICSAAPAAGQDRPQDYHAALRAACGKEINSQCEGVADQRGRLLACLYKDRTNLSTRCNETVVGSLEVLGKALGSHESVRRYCDRDQQQYCKGVVTGGGNLVGCLLFARHMVSAKCKATVNGIWSKNRHRG